MFLLLAGVALVSSAVAGAAVWEQRRRAALLQLESLTVLQFRP